ncbi:MAG: ADP-ribosylglycohydrolase family protein [Bacteroidota bacterium]
MKGAIIGDIVGSRFEKNNYKGTDFTLFDPACRYTDDTVLTVAIAAAILEDESYEKEVKKFALAHPLAGYGGTFKQWMLGIKKGPYNSWGNGSAMRVSPVGFAFAKEVEVLQEAEKSAAITHNHPEGIKGAQAIALGVWMGKQGFNKPQIKARIEEQFGYDLNRSVAEIRPHYTFDVSCQGSVPEAIIAFLEGENFEQIIRLAVSLGGDTDTIASMAGALAEAYYQEIPAEMWTSAQAYLPKSFLPLIQAFYEMYGYKQTK